MTKVLIIDDETIRIPIITSHIERSISPEKVHIECRIYVPPNDVLARYDIVYFDHDLGNGGDTYHVLSRRYHQGETLPFTLCAYIHSMNPVGAKALEKLLLIDYGLERVSRMPFDEIYESVKQREQ